MNRMNHCVVPGGRQMRQPTDGDSTLSSTPSCGSDGLFVSVSASARLAVSHDATSLPTEHDFTLASKTFMSIPACLMIARLAAGSHTRRQSGCCMLLPPSVRTHDSLRRDCERKSQGGDCVYDLGASSGYQVATTLFRTIATLHETEAASTSLWFPSLQHGDQTMRQLAAVVNGNSDRIGKVTAESSTWPRVPTTCITLRCSKPVRPSSSVPHIEETAEDIASEIANTEEWVQETLCRLALCPYTSSLNRAAVGLDSVGVQPGAIAIQRSSSVFPDHPYPAAALAASFWEEVTRMVDTSEQNLATTLLVAPDSFDDDFLEFASVCDELIEPAVQAVGATDIVGRAWFHPLYNSSSIGHDKMLPGHALPAVMVESFVDRYLADESSEVSLSSPLQRPSSKEIARANDAVRWTPHATINLLRRSQLSAAKQVEATLSNKKPNYVYVRNVLRLLSDGKLLLDR